MKLTALTCMYEKPVETMRQVLTVLREQVEQSVIVLDRPSQSQWGVFHEIYGLGSGGIQVLLTGIPGWRSPCLSLNAGMQHVTGDHLLIIQGDVVLTPGSAQKARQLLQERPAAYFGMVTESDPDKYRGVAGHAGPVLCSSTNPRPLTYLLAVPTEAVKAIGGWDEAFQAGVWHEDDDFTARLWEHGLDFIFTDEISGIHQTHARGYFNEMAIATNLGIFLNKHGTSRFFDKEFNMGRIKKLILHGRTEWRHV